ncbi:MULTISPECIES: RnfABCDGE type electron transport complex subunit G [unclassified Pseudomonas]|uniref:RnfABCDGE type electron transport complex subunit G n=1 Tax=unclassified Pseudomonas TaxID=196821 RepID=UPI00244BC07E|nr:MULTISPECIES: RnfABCDGE type electron transport complex subunit G [unclassified Pseudomonas]MDH0303990.1 RnfABCDGE type electron transport complex subunit G [Pseudomonas sp. GD04091]MDH1986161.1 RnfABCDGE type electron transport complex subunit G [Pseudomonas sp. GD03689]
MNARWRSTLLLLLVIGLALATTLAWQRWTAQPIAERTRQLQQQQWLAVLPQGSYDNQPLDAPLPLIDTTLRHSRLLAGYRASLANAPVAVLLHSSVQGYAAPIRLIIAVDIQGRLLGVRVLEQQESPGLGSRLVDPALHWLDQFTGKTLSDTPEPRWAIKRDHGAFDQLAGATVTSRAVIDAIQDALRYFDEHRASLLGEVNP